MKKVMVIGCPGSGKSTFSRKLQKLTGLPLYHLDMLYWNADKTTVEKAEFRRRLAEIMQKEEWIIDGNYNSTIEPRLQVCDTAFFLDYPTEVCLNGIYSRRGQPQSDMPWVESEQINEDFVQFVKDYAQESRPRVLELLRQYAEKSIVIFKTREEADVFLQSLIQ